VIWPPNLGFPWFWAAFFVRFIALIGAILLARRQRTYAPIAWFLGLATSADIARILLSVFILGSGPPGGLPYSGWARVAFHVEQAFFISWPIGIAALSVHIVAKRKFWPVGIAYLVVLAILVGGYPTIRRELLQSVYLAVTLASILVSLGAAASWWTAKRTTTPPERAVLIFIVGEAAAIVGPYAAGLIDVNWPIAHGAYLGLYLVLAALEVVWLRRS
jgi:hypothetical protein